MYFLYTNQSRLEHYDRSDVTQHPIHAHFPPDISNVLAEGFDSWNDVMEFRRKRFEKARNRPTDIQGPGEGGEPVSLSPEEQAEADRLFAKETFNVIASNKVAMDRRIRDLRPEAYVLSF